MSVHFRSVLVSTSCMQGSSQFGVVVADHILHSSSSQCHQHHHDYSVSCLCVKGNGTHDVMLVEQFLLDMLAVNKSFSCFHMLGAPWHSLISTLDVGITSLQDVRLRTCDVITRHQTK